MAQLSSQPVKLPGIHNVIAVSSGRGGVGKTFVATSLALLLAKMGKRVGLMDGDITCPTVFKMLGIAGKIIPTAEGKIVPTEKYGIKVVSMAGLTTSDEEPIVWRGPILSKIIQKFLKETLWGELDFLIIDLPNSATDASLTVMQSVTLHGLILVTTPEVIATSSSKRMANMAIMLGVPLLGVVENMRGEVFGDGGSFYLAQQLAIPLLGSIPLRKQIASGNDTGTPPVLYNEEVGIIVNKIIRLLMGKVVVQ